MVPVTFVKNIDCKDSMAKNVAAATGPPSSGGITDEALIIAAEKEKEAPIAPASKSREEAANISQEDTSPAFQAAADYLPIQPTTVSAVAPVVRPSSRLSPLYWLTRTQPTNYDMLIFRTLNQDMDEPNHNKDYLAIKLRDELMPIRFAMDICILFLMSVYDELKRYGNSERKVCLSFRSFKVIRLK